MSFQAHICLKYKSLKNGHAAFVAYNNIVMWCVNLPKVQNQTL